MKFKTPILALIASATLFGCASNDQVELMADHRASIIEAGLPYKLGPLNVMSAKANENVVEILMIYNSSGTIAPNDLVNASAKAYCQDNSVKAVLEKGVVYKINVRSERGKLLVEKIIDQQTCVDAEEEADS